MDYIAQIRVLNPHQLLFLKRRRKPGYRTAISKIHTKSRTRRHIPKRGQLIKTLLISVFLNVNVLNTPD